MEKGTLQDIEAEELIAKIELFILLMILIFS